jgi:hypothetical protein
VGREKIPNFLEAFLQWYLLGKAKWKTKLSCHVFALVSFRTGMRKIDEGREIRVRVNILGSLKG